MPKKLPPKPKESRTKKQQQIARLNISDASLNFIPNDALEGIFFLNVTFKQITC